MTAMNKREFLLQLEKGLSGLPKDEVNERLDFYGEIIDDRVEEGLSEEEAVAEIGSVGEIVSQIISDIPLHRLMKEKMQPKHELRAWETVFLILGSPIWLSLLLMFFAFMILAYTVMWSLIISLWCVFAGIIGCAVGGLLGGTVTALTGRSVSGIALVGAGIVCAGLAIFMFYGCDRATEFIALLTKKFALAVKGLFVRKEEAR